MNKLQICARLDRLIGKLGGQDTKVNAKVGKAIGVSKEAVRQWRNSISLPRFEHLDSLISYLSRHGINTSPEYVLFGHTIEARNVNIRERIADDGDELELLQVFRSASPKGKQLILEMARAYQLSHPVPSTVVPIHQGKRRH